MCGSCASVCMCVWVSLPALSAKGSESQEKRCVLVFWHAYVAQHRLHFKGELTDWGAATESVKGGLRAIEERLKEYSDANTRMQTRGKALVGSSTGVGYKETPLWLSRQTEVALGAGRRWRETSNDLQDEKRKKDEGKRKDKQEAAVPV